MTRREKSGNDKEKRNGDDSGARALLSPRFTRKMQSIFLATLDSPQLCYSELDPEFTEPFLQSGADNPIRSAYSLLIKNKKQKTA